MIATFLDSLYVTVFGMSVVFIVLIGLNCIIKLQTYCYNWAIKRKTSNPGLPEEVVAEKPPALSQVTSDKLKLINVDEKTAAIIMAIVSDKIQIPPQQLNFKSIKGLKTSLEKQTKEQEK